MIKLCDWQRKQKKTTLEMLVSGGVLLVDDIKAELENISGGATPLRSFWKGQALEGTTGQLLLLRTFYLWYNQNRGESNEFKNQ